MRIVRVFGGVLLLTIGIPALLAGAVLGMLTRHADSAGAFSARFETVHTPGHAVVVRDLDGLLRAEAPFTRAGQSRLRLEARTADGPAFVGLAPADEVRRWLDPVPHAEVHRVALARGPLPVRLGPAAPSAGIAPAVAPITQPFWVREGIGALEWSPEDLADRRLSLVVMRPDGRADLTLELRAELRAGWTAPATAALLAGGVLTVALAVLLLLRPVRPREVVFVVEPDQVPVLAGRLGVTSLSGLGAQPTRDSDRSRTVGRQLASVGAGNGGSLPAIGPVPARRPETLADLAGDGPAFRPPGVSLSLAWPPVTTAETAPPVPTEGRLRPAAPESPDAPR
ncbi:hypothetical protein GA0070606_2018 [Micromonospora citrea]|uniref:Uncharacterized protein n=1 Tax=Micromonospora citrea TaxID=47855 RepID=A0A1C6UFQ8_9ACTN|nr:hypothetical protein GA0070606_2018 [Micromonospora citrea]